MRTVKTFLAGMILALLAFPVWADMTISQGGTATVTINTPGSTPVFTTVQVTSNTILQGTTVYQSGQVVMGSGASVTISSNVITGGATFYQNGEVGLGATPAVGSAGQFFASQGASAVPVWAAPTVSTYTWTAQQTFNNAVAISTTLALGAQGSVGNAYQIPQSNGSGSNPGWVNGGRYVQIVSTNTSTQTQTTSASFGIVSGMGITVTPLTASSTIYISFHGVIFVNGATIGQIEVMNGAGTNLIPGNIPAMDCEGNATVAVTCGISYEFPYNYNSVSPLQIHLTMASSDGTHNVLWNHNNNALSWLHVKEFF